MDLRPALVDHYLRHLADDTFVSWLALDGDCMIDTSGMSIVELPPYFGCPMGGAGIVSGMFTEPAHRERFDKKQGKHKHGGCLSQPNCDPNMLAALARSVRGLRMVKPPESSV